MRDQQPSAGRSGPGSRGSGLQLPPWGRGPGRPPGVAAGGGWRPRHRGGAGGRCPRTTPARPERAPLRPSRRSEGSAGRAPEQGKHPWGTLSPRPRAPAGSPPLRADEPTGGRRPAPPPRPGVPRAPGARRRSLGPRRPAAAAPGLGLAPGPSGAHSGPGRPDGAQESIGDLPRPPMVGVTLPPNHPVGRALPGSRPGARRRRAGDASRAPSESPPPPPQAVPLRRRGPEEARPFRLGGRGLRPGPGSLPCRATRSPEGDGILRGGAGGVEGAKRWRRRRGPGAGNQSLGMAARRVAPGQARGMKGSLSSSDTASGFLLPPPPASLIGAGC